jgi:hypothetical protein
MVDNVYARVPLCSYLQPHGDGPARPVDVTTDFRGFL